MVVAFYHAYELKCKDNLMEDAIATNDIPGPTVAFHDAFVLVDRDP
jgi:hypothetical protein